MVQKRFAVLRHETAGGVHWDLMLESNGVLLTWSVPPLFEGMPDRAIPSFESPAVRLPDHRMVYLDFEGPVSRNRGEVRRIDAGTYEPKERSRFQLRGNLFFGTISIVPFHPNGFQEEDAAATLSFESSPATENGGYHAFADKPSTSFRP